MEKWEAYWNSRRIQLILILTMTLGLSACASVRSVRENRNFVAKGYSQEALSTMPVPPADAAPRKRLIVLPFLNDSPYESQAMADRARSVFLRELSESNEFLVISNNDLPQNPSEFIVNGEYNLQNLAGVAQSYGVAAVVEGKILEIKVKRLSDPVGVVRQLRVSVEASVRIRAVSTKNGHEIVNEVRNARVDTSVTRFLEGPDQDRNLIEDPELIRAVVLRAFKGLDHKISQAVEKLNWEGRVALVMSDKIYVNAGRLSGLQIGDILKVMDEGEEVYDPESGILLGRTSGRMKGTVEVVSYFGKDGAIGVVHSGSGFKENDRVQLY